MAALHPDYTAELALFGQLVGEWKVAHQARTRGGPWTDSQRTWIFSWALDGRAVDLGGSHVGPHGVDTAVQFRKAQMAVGVDKHR